LKTMLWLMALVGAFCAGIEFERERRRRADEANLKPVITVPYRLLGAEDGT
jgi:hypothetical protein